MKDSATPAHRPAAAYPASNFHRRPTIRPIRMANGRRQNCDAVESRYTVSDRLGERNTDDVGHPTFRGRPTDFE